MRKYQYKKIKEAKGIIGKIEWETPSWVKTPYDFGQWLIAQTSNKLKKYIWIILEAGCFYYSSGISMNNTFEFQMPCTNECDFNRSTKSMHLYDNEDSICIHPQKILEGRN